MASFDNPIVNLPILGRLNVRILIQMKCIQAIELRVPSSLETIRLSSCVQMDTLPTVLSSEPSYEPVTKEGSTYYERTLLGSERVYDQLTLTYNGMPECAMGFEFEAPQWDWKMIKTKAFRAWAHLRFIYPNLAASMIHDEIEYARKWSYKLTTNVDDAVVWAAQTFEVLDEPIENEGVIALLNQRKLETEQYPQIMRALLTRLPSRESTYGIFMHGTHAIMDARPTLNAFKRLFATMVSETPLLEELPWGQEYENLPKGPVTITGGLREDAHATLPALAKRVFSDSARDTPTLGPHLATMSRGIMQPGLPVRVRITFSVEDSAAIIRALKHLNSDTAVAHGENKRRVTITNLFEAAQILTIFQANEVPDEQALYAHVTLPANYISLVPWLSGPYKTQERFTSETVVVPLSIPYTDYIANAGQPAKAQLVAMMHQLRDQYELYLSDPCLPHLTAYTSASADMRFGISSENPLAAMITNLGVVEQICPVAVSSGKAGAGEGTESLIRLTDMVFGHRMTFYNAITHIWTFDSRVNVQLEASDVWDRSVLQNYLEAICANARHLLD
ncbi:hypothetical protein BDW22DRAFT_1430758 [Trametopsis cervina]|nr:hypothetical protein BDW22DRAFT_1430758 [Trametopsis cervina]